MGRISYDDLSLFRKTVNRKLMSMQNELIPLTAYSEEQRQGCEDGWFL